jgi:hypothetical protein
MLAKTVRVRIHADQRWPGGGHNRLGAQQPRPPRPRSSPPPRSRSRNVRVSEPPRARRAAGTAACLPPNPSRPSPGSRRRDDGLGLPPVRRLKPARIRPVRPPRCAIAGVGSRSRPPPTQPLGRARPQSCRPIPGCPSPVRAHLVEDRLRGPHVLLVLVKADRHHGAVRLVGQEQEPRGRDPLGRLRIGADRGDVRLDRLACAPVNRATRAYMISSLRCVYRPYPGRAPRRGVLVRSAFLALSVYGEDGSELDVSDTAATDGECWIC